MNDYLIRIFAAMVSAFISSSIFIQINKKYNFINWIKIKLRINSKFKSILFIVLITTLIDAVTLGFISSTTIYYYSIKGFLIGALFLFI